MAITVCITVSFTLTQSASNNEQDFSQESNGLYYYIEDHHGEKQLAEDHFSKLAMDESEYISAFGFFSEGK